MGDQRVREEADSQKCATPVPPSHPPSLPHSFSLSPSLSPSLSLALPLSLPLSRSQNRLFSFSLPPSHPHSCRSLQFLGRVQRSNTPLTCVDSRRVAGGTSAGCLRAAEARPVLYNSGCLRRSHRPMDKRVQETQI